jgi:hypothetical protein
MYFSSLDDKKASTHIKGRRISAPRNIVTQAGPRLGGRNKDNNRGKSFSKAPREAKILFPVGLWGKRPGILV